MIERLHYTLKSGLRVERLQIDDARSLGHALALLYVVAWRLMSLTLAARQCPEGPASMVLEADEIEALSAAEGRTVKTAVEAVRAIAKLGGFLPYRKTPPGLKTIWQGWRYLQAMVVGYKLAKQRKSGL